MKIAKQSLFLVLAILFVASVAAADEKSGGAAMAGPMKVSDATYPIAVGNGEFELRTTVLEFEPGAGVAEHRHGGNVLVTVLSGELTLREKGTERVMKTGESWTEAPGNVHSVTNAGSAAARVVASFLLPKGAEVTTMVK